MIHIEVCVRFGSLFSRLGGGERGKSFFTRPRQEQTLLSTKLAHFFFHYWVSERLCPASAWQGRLLSYFVVGHWGSMSALALSAGP